MTAKNLSINVRSFLQMAQPLTVKYGYSRGVPTGDSIVTYQDMSSNVRTGIGNSIISERRTYIVTVQTKTAEGNLVASELIKLAMHQSLISLVSEDMRKDTTVANGWINTLIISVFNPLTATKRTYSADEVRIMLQEIADRYLFVTSQYAETISGSTIDSYTVPPLVERTYFETEVLAMKQEYLDRLILTTTQF